MELIEHNTMKTMGRKKVTNCCQKTQNKQAAQKVPGKKTFQVSTFDTSISHQDLTISNNHHFRESLELSEIETIENIKYSMVNE